MADASILASALLGEKKPNPLTQRYKYGTDLMKQGSSTEPVRSPLEGLARALQAGIGGWVANDAITEQKAQDKANIGALASALGAKSPDELTAAIQGSQLDADVIAPMLATMLGEKQKQWGAQRAAGEFGAAYGAPVPGTPSGVTGTSATGGAPSGGWPVININRGPINAPGAPGGDVTSNNVGNTTNLQGNFKQFATPQDGAADVAQWLQRAPVQWNGGQPMSINQYAQKYDGGNAQVWANNVARGSGFDPNQPLNFDDPAVISRLVKAINAAEKAPQDLQPPVVLAQGVQQQMDPAAFGAPQGEVSGQPRVQMAQAPAPQPMPQGDNIPSQPPQSAASEPPAVPKPQPTPEQLKRYQTLVGSGQMSVAQASQALEKELNDQWSADKQRALEVWKDQQSSKRIHEQADVNLVQKAPLEIIGKRVDAYETKTRPAAVAAANDINSIHQVRQVLDSGAFTGTGANAKTFLAKLGEQLGIPSEQAQNTQVLGAVLAKRVLAGSGGSLGTGFSNADRDFMEKAQGGQITMDESALRRLLDIGERQARLTLRQHDEEAGRIKGLPGMAAFGSDYFTVPAAPSYAEWSKANPPPQGQGAAAPATSVQTTIPTVQTPDEARRLPRGTQFRTPDGRLLTVP